jgi:hypothetical protein
LRLLRDEGLLEFRRGRGVSVVGTPERGAVVQKTKELVEFARRQGYRVDELVEIIEDLAWATSLAQAAFPHTGASYGDLFGPLRARRLVLDLLRLAQGIHRFVYGQEDCRLERAKRTAASNRQRNRGHGHVVGGLP